MKILPKIKTLPWIVLGAISISALVRAQKYWSQKHALKEPTNVLAFLAVFFAVIFFLHGSMAFLLIANNFVL